METLHAKKTITWDEKKRMLNYSVIFIIWKSRVGYQLLKSRKNRNFSEIKKSQNTIHSLRISDFRAII